MSNDSTPSKSLARDNALQSLQRALPQVTGCSISLERGGIRIVRQGRIAQVHADRLSVELFHLGEDGQALIRAESEEDLIATVCLRVPDDELVFFSRLLATSGLAAATVAALLGSPAESTELCLALPEEIIATRRRGNFRVAVALDDHLEMRLWRIDEYAILLDQPPPSQSFKCLACDLSADGMRAMLWAGRVRALGLAANQRFRIELKLGEVDTVIEARLRHPRATLRDQESACCGFEFILEAADFHSRRSRQKLDAMLGVLQRSAARRLSAA